ncbi:hypothetical protein D3C71_1302710 [compost metagenome]
MASSITARCQCRSRKAPALRSQPSASAFRMSATRLSRLIRCRVQPRVRAVVSCPARMKVRMLDATSWSDRPEPSPSSSRALSRAVSRSSGASPSCSIRARRRATRASTRSLKKRASPPEATRPRRGIQSGAFSASSGLIRAPTARKWFSAFSKPAASPSRSSENSAADRMSKVRPLISLSMFSTRAPCSSRQPSTRRRQTRSMASAVRAVWAGVNRGAMMRRARRHCSPSVSSRPSASMGPSTRRCRSPFS